MSGADPENPENPEKADHAGHAIEALNARTYFFHIAIEWNSGYNVHNSTVHTQKDDVELLCVVQQSPVA